MGKKSHVMTSSRVSDDSIKDTKRSTPRHDVLAWIISCCFIVVWIGAMWGWGKAYGWYAPSGYYHDVEVAKSGRFLAEPEGCNDTSIPGRSGQFCTTNWYYWKINPNTTTALTHATCWVGYSLHQIFVWALIFKAQLDMDKGTFEKTAVGPKYSGRIRWHNIALLVVNAIFHIFHLVQTHWTYDATAQDTALQSSQASVVMMMCVVLLMEYRDRGLFFMWPNPRSDDCAARKLRLNQGPIRIVRKYHGYAFSWACIYTFWYHPMENTWGHSMGFMHTAVVLLQGSLIYTEMHLNKYWRLVNECWTLLHTSVIAWQTGNPSSGGGTNLWPMFLWGYMFLLGFTQIYGLPPWKKLPAWVRIIPPVVILAIIVALAGTVVQGLKPDQTGFDRLYEMLYIPALEYLDMFLIWLFLYAFIAIDKCFPRFCSERLEPVMCVVYVALALTCFAALVLGSYLARFVGGPSVLMMEIFVTIFCFAIMMSFMLLERFFRRYRRHDDASSSSASGDEVSGDESIEVKGRGNGISNAALDASDTKISSSM